jgi:hypothetical protein
VKRKILGQASAFFKLALLWSAQALAQSSPHSFSADLVTLEPGIATPAVLGKLHAANRMVRIETQTADGFFISDADAGTALFVRSAQRIYMNARQSSALTWIFVWVDPRNPCRQWQAAAATAGMPGNGDWHCEPIRRSSIHRREIIEYSVMTADRQKSRGWVDVIMGFPVKWQGPDGKLLVLENILQQPQPAGLFSFPPDFRKLDPKALLERIKHSDVWADSPQ